MVDRPRAAAEHVRTAQRFGEVRLGSLHRFERLLPQGEAGGDGRRKRTAGAVRVPGGDARAAELVRPPSVEEDVHRLALEMAALDEDRARPERLQIAGRLRHGLHAAHGPPEERLRLREVRGHDLGEREQPLAVGALGGGVEETVAALGDHHRVDDEMGQAQARDGLRDRLHDGAVGEHARLDRGHRHVGGDGLELRHHHARLQGDVVDDGHRVLRGDGRDRRGAVQPVGGEGPQVGLDAGASARIGAGDGEGDPHCGGSGVGPSARTGKRSWRPMNIRYVRPQITTSSTRKHGNCSVDPW